MAAIRAVLATCGGRWRVSLLYHLLQPQRQAARDATTILGIVMYLWHLCWTYSIAYSMQLTLLACEQMDIQVGCMTFWWAFYGLGTAYKLPGDSAYTFPNDRDATACETACCCLQQGAVRPTALHAPGLTRMSDSFCCVPNFLPHLQAAFRRNWAPSLFGGADTMRR